MPWGDWVNELPTAFFMVVHIAAFALGAGFAWLAFKRDLSLLGAAFSLFAAAELVYMTYHLDWTVFLFAHTIAEVLDLSAFVLVFAAAVCRPQARAGPRWRRPGDSARSSRPPFSPRSRSSSRRAAARAAEPRRWRRRR